jgi:hypothetical protein
MNWTAGKTAAAMLALGVMVSGCATRESVEHAQASADGADRHAGVAMSRADEAFGVGNKALGVGNDAKQAALTAEQKADQANADLAIAKQKIAYLEWKTSPHKKKHHHHHVAPQADPKNT